MPYSGYDDDMGYVYNRILAECKKSFFFCQYLPIVQIFSLYKFQVINKIIPIRMHEWEELVGADFFEHDIRHPNVGVSR